MELFRGLLAGKKNCEILTMKCLKKVPFIYFLGNIFDRGAQAVTQILENDHSFGLHEALDRIESRPWLIDGLDDWLERLRQVTGNGINTNISNRTNMHRLNREALINVLPSLWITVASI